MQVLMIEDIEADYLLVNHFIAKITDVTLEWRDSLEQGLAYLDSNPIDVLLLDLALPDGHGLAVLDKVQGRFPILPIIILSGNDAEELAVEAVRHGAQDYLMKGQINGPLLRRALRYALERKRLEERLRQSEEEFRSAFNYAAIGKALVALDGRWMKVNNSLCSMLGYSEQELKTKTFQDLTHPDDLDADLNYVQQLLAGEIETFQLEKRYFHKAGHQVWGLLSVSLVRNSEGQPVHFISQVQDITQRKQVELALAAERNLLRTLIDNIPDYIFVKDTQGRFLLSNIAHAQAAGLAPDELVGKTAFEVFPSEFAAQFQADDEQVLQDAQALINLERSTIDKHQVNKTVLTTKAPIYDKDGQIIGVVGISRDITERKQLETKTIELLAERGRTKILQSFINNISHDLRTPLALISTSLYLIQKHTDPEKQRLHAVKAEEQVVWMKKLLDELLQMKQLDEDEISFQFSLTEMNTFLAPFIQEYERLTIPKQISLEFIPEIPSFFAQIDTIHFARVLTKLLDNAIVYTPEGGKIVVRTSTWDKWSVITVQDTGIGIDASNLPHIFERFYRVDEARSGQTGGTGLGLSIVQKIVEAHNGSIEVQSTLGQGSTFTIKLPIDNRFAHPMDVE
jgi:PAS domain S-box-containing protein